VTASAKTPAKRRRARTFADGLVMGLAAPSLLVSGILTEYNPSRTSGLGSAWNNVGHYIRQSSDAHRAANGRSKRRT
jgi:hypothetical protein